MTTTLSNHASLSSSFAGGATGGRGVASAGVAIASAGGGRCAADSAAGGGGGSSSNHHGMNHHVEDAGLILGQEEDEDVIFEDEEIASIEADGTADDAGQTAATTTTSFDRMEKTGECEEAPTTSASIVDRQLLNAALVSSMVDLGAVGGKTSTRITPTTPPRSCSSDRVSGATTINNANTTTAASSSESARRKSPRKQHQQPQQSLDANDALSSSCLQIGSQNAPRTSSVGSPKKVTHYSTVASPSESESSPGRTIYQRATKTQHQHHHPTTTITTTSLTSTSSGGYLPPNASNVPFTTIAASFTVQHPFITNNNTTVDTTKCHPRQQHHVAQIATSVPPKMKKRSTTNSNTSSSPSPNAKKQSTRIGSGSSKVSMVPNPLARVQDVCSSSGAKVATASASTTVTNIASASLSSSSTPKKKNSSSNNAKQRSPRKSNKGCLTKKTDTLMSAVVSLPQHALSSSHAAAAATQPQQSYYEHPSTFSYETNNTNNNNNMLTDNDGGGGQIMASIAESMFSQHYQSDGLMMASYSATSGGAVGGILGCGSNGGGGGMDSHPPNAGRGRIFSIDLDPAVLEFVDSLHCDKTDDEMTTSGTSKNVTFKEDNIYGGGGRGGISASTTTTARRDRGFSFEFFSFGINEDEPLPPVPPAYYHSGSTTTMMMPTSTTSYIPQQGTNRPRGDSIIFDPTSFRDGGIHETSALLQHEETSLEVVGSMTSSAAAPASHQEMHCIDPHSSLSLDLHSTSTSAMPPQRALSSDALPTKTLQAKTSSSNLPKSSRTKTKHHPPRIHSSMQPYKSIPSLPPIHEDHGFNSLVSSSSSRMHHPQAFSDNTIHMPHGSDAAAAAIAGGCTTSLIMIPSSSSSTATTTIATNQDGYSVSHTSCPMDLLNKDGRIGIYLPEERRSRIAKFHSKRMVRTWRKKIKYDCRKKLADSRPRIKGRFVKRSDVDGE